jgi:hypothetical protein
LLRASKFEKNFLLYNTPKKNIYLVYTIYNNKLLYIIYPIYIKKKGNLFFLFWVVERCPTDERRLKEKKKFREKEKKCFVWGVVYAFYPFSRSVACFYPLCGILGWLRCFSLLYVIVFFSLIRWQKTMFCFFCTERNNRNFPKAIYLFWRCVVIIADI